MGLFATTRWSLVALASVPNEDHGAALEQLCRIYRPAVLNWFRYQGLDPDAAGDLTQSFFAKLLEADMLGVADPERGRFRTFLSTSLRNFYLHQLERSQARKRGGGAVFVKLEDTLSEDPGNTPEQAFDRDFARLVISRALARLSDETHRAGRGALFESLREFLLEPPDRDDYERLVETLSMRRNTIAVAVHRMRSRLKELTREELMDTVSDEESLNEELRFLRRSFTGLAAETG